MPEGFTGQAIDKTSDGIRDILKFFHPAIPFVTEELYSHLVADSLLITASWPDVPSYEAPASMDTLQELIVGVRRFRAEHGLSPRQPLEVTIHDPEGIAEDWWAAQLEALAGITMVLGDPPATSGHSRVVAGAVQAFVPLAGVVDIDAERARLKKRVDEATKDLSQAERKLGDDRFRERAPAAVVAKEEAKADEARALIEKLDAQLAELGG